MRLLLDTHVLLWWLDYNPKLSPVACRAINDPATTVAVSAASAWEIAIKAALGKLEAPSDLEARLVTDRLDPLPITVAHALEAGALPRHHDDPFDRMLVAQARLDGYTLVTADPVLGRYQVAILPA